MIDLRVQFELCVYIFSHVMTIHYNLISISLFTLYQNMTTCPEIIIKQYVYLKNLLDAQFFKARLEILLKT